MFANVTRWTLVLLSAAALGTFAEPVRAQGRCGRTQSGQNSMRAYPGGQQSTLQTQAYLQQRALQQYQLQNLYAQQLSGLAQDAYLQQLLAQQYVLQAQLAAYQQAALQGTTSASQRYQQRNQQRQAAPVTITDGP